MTTDKTIYIIDTMQSMIHCAMNLVLPSAAF